MSDTDTSQRKIMLGTAGHVDHGKSSLVKLLTGCETDRLAEEKRRGLSIELGYAPCSFSDQRIAGIIDAPGHVDFIRNMVCGAHAVDLAIICIAADDGVMPQTREHVAILDLMGVSRAVVALTRSDLVDEARIAAASGEIRQLLSKTAMADAAICPLSNITGDGLSELTAELLNSARDFYPQRPTGGFRMWIDRVFNVKGFGVVVTGIPTTGSVSVGDKLYLASTSEAFRVRSMQVYGKNCQRGGSGQCVALNLSDGQAKAEAEKLTRGQLLSASEKLPVSNMFEAELSILNTALTLEDYCEVHVHIGSAHQRAAVALLEGRPISPGDSGLVQLRMDGDLSVRAGEHFIIRGQQADRPVTTIGGGVVLDSCNKRLKRKRPWTIKRLQTRRDALVSPDKWLLAIMAEQHSPLDAHAIAALSDMTSEQLESVLKKAVADGSVRQIASGTFIATSVLEKIAEKVAVELESTPEQSAYQLAKKLNIDAILTAQLLEEMQLSKRVKCTNAVDATKVFSLADAGDTDSAKGTDDANAEPQLSPEARMLDEILQQAQLAPPLPQDIQRRCNMTQVQFDAALAQLAACGRCVRLDAKVIMHRSAIEAAKAVAIELFRQKDFFETVEFRDRLGVSRKYAIALLDWFDGQRFTTRNAHLRRAGAEAKKLL